MRNFVLAASLALGGVAAAAPASAADAVLGVGFESSHVVQVGWRDDDDYRGWRGERLRDRPYRSYRRYDDDDDYRYRPRRPRVRYYSERRYRDRDCEIRRIWNGDYFVRRRICY